MRWPRATLGSNFTSGNQEASFALVERAIAADYKTLILTVDVPKWGTARASFDAAFERHSR